MEKNTEREKSTELHISPMKAPRHLLRGDVGFHMQSRYRRSDSTIPLTIQSIVEHWTIKLRYLEQVIRQHPQSRCISTNLQARNQATYPTCINESHSLSRKVIGLLLSSLILLRIILPNTKSTYITNQIIHFKIPSMKATDASLGQLKNIQQSSPSTLP